MSDGQEFKVGDRVHVIALPAYVKTADPMPMLRPPDVIRLGEEGIVMDRKPGDFWCVRLERGTFLLDSQYLQLIHAPAAAPATAPDSAAAVDQEPAADDSVPTDDPVASDADDIE